MQRSGNTLPTAWTDAHRCSDRSRTYFEYHVERRLSGAAEAPESRFSRDLAQSAFPRLGTEPQGHLLRQRCRRANEGRRVIEDAPDRVEIVLEIVMRKRLDDHPRPVLGQRFLDMLARSHGVAHVMQAIEERHQIIVFRRKILGAGLRERDAVSNSRFLSQYLRAFDRRLVVIEPEEL